MALRGIDLFCGAGGMSLGFSDAGIHAEAALDAWLPAVKTYELNFPDAAVVHGDAAHPKVFEALATAVDGIDTVDVVFGGPPCQAFSTAGYRSPTDARASCVSAFLSYVKFLKPAAFVIENVPGVLSARVPKPRLTKQRTERSRYQRKENSTNWKRRAGNWKQK